MPNVRILDATDVAALLPPQESPAVLKAALLKAGGDGVGGIEWNPDATKVPSVGTKAPAGTAALLRGVEPRLLVDRAAFTARRGAAITGLAAQLADPRTEVLTVLGCNAIARASFEVVRAIFPDLERVLCFDPDVDRQAQFADEIMTTFNVAAIIPPEPREACEGAQILVGCPDPLPKKPVVEFDWLQRGTLVVMLHGASAFTDAMLQRADRRIADDLAGWNAAAAAGRLQGVPQPEGDLAALAAGKLPARNGSPLIACVCFGSPAVDAALASALLTRAEQAGRGRTLAL